jgi:aminoglycoside phosphotransferase (APT) family kinase protein
LARINSIPVADLADTHIDTSVDLTTLVRETIETTCQQARSFDNPSRVHLEMACHWLMQNIHLADDVPCLTHCDVGLHNIMIKDGAITAMLDWELATLASPAREISKIFHLIDYLMPREDFFAAYLAAGGPVNAVEPARLNFYAVMN